VVAAVAGVTAAAASLITFGPPGLAAAAMPVPARSVAAATTPLSPDLSGVWCSGRHDCIAVGTDQQDNPISVVWNGESWRYVSTPAKGHDLSALACQNPTECLAVGGLGAADQWNGRSWRLLATPVSVSLLSIACPRRRLCVAVGGTDYAHGMTGAIIWHGTAWRTTTVPRPAGSLGGDLISVSCASSTNCLAVGSYHTRQRHSIPMAAAWNGSRWRLLAAPPVRPLAVACTKPASCMAVGNGWSMAWNGRSWRKLRLAGIYSPLGLSCPSSKFCMVTTTAYTDTWNGTSWSRVSPAQNGTVALWCGSATDCMAVGGGTAAGNTSQWNGTSWTMLRVNKVESLATVSCGAPAACVTLGTTNGPAEPASTWLAEQWSGGPGWRRIAGPAVTGIDGLTPMSCPGARFCMAVGYGFSGLQAADEWNGRQWKLISLPALPGPLWGVSCTSADNCVAVGFDAALVWNGTSWRTTNAGMSGQTVGLQSVSCSAGSCMAFGYHLSSSCQINCPIHELAEQWNGTSWTVSYDVGIGDNPVGPAHISCPGAGFCMEVTGQAVLSWSGGTWQPVPSSFPGQASSISCTSRSSCMAVGIYRIGTNTTNHDFAEVWNGASWRATSTRGSGGTMEDVSCAGAGQCMAVGSTADFLTMAQRWNGTSWTVLKTVNP
jgi:hypothetical protein